MKKICAAALFCVLVTSAYGQTLIPSNPPSASALIGTTLAPNVVTSSLTSVGTLGGLTVNGGAPAITSTSGSDVTLASGGGGGVIALNAGAGGGYVTIGTNGSTFTYIANAASFFPNSNNAKALGDSGLTWGGLWVTLTSDAASTDSTVCTLSTGEFRKGSGTLGICLGTSGEQFKDTITPMVAGLDEVAKLNLINYRYKPGYGDDGERIQYGMTAQDVERVMPDLVRHDSSGEAITFDIGALLPVALKAIQELKNNNDRLQHCQRSWKCRIFGLDR